jgi:hypothetical protein
MTSVKKNALLGGPAHDHKRSMPPESASLLGLII